MHDLSADDVRLLRLRAQRLDGCLASRGEALCGEAVRMGAGQDRAGGSGAEQVRRTGAGRVRDSVASVFAVQAQDEAAAGLGIWARSGARVAEDVAEARDGERSIVRVWCWRGTLHLVAAEDCHWLLDVLRPALLNANRARRAQLGLDDALTERGVEAVRHMLGNGYLSRAEIAERLGRLGIPSAGQATIHILWRAALDGVVCCGPHRGDETTFVLLEDWVPAAPRLEREAALAELARRYLDAYGPARPADLAAWSGLSPGEARRAWGYLGGHAVEVQTPGGPMWLAASQVAWLAQRDGSARGDRTVGNRGRVGLLPAFDGLWLGYRDRDWLVSREHARRLHPGGGVIRPSVLRDGRAIGTWTRRVRGRTLDVVLELWEPLAPEARETLNVEVADLGCFLGVPARLVEPA